MGVVVGGSRSGVDSSRCALMRSALMNGRVNWQTSMCPCILSLLNMAGLTWMHSMNLCQALRVNAFREAGISLPFSTATV